MGKKNQITIWIISIIIFLAIIIALTLIMKLTWWIFFGILILGVLSLATVLIINHLRKGKQKPIEKKIMSQDEAIIFLTNKARDRYTKEILPIGEEIKKIGVLGSEKSNIFHLLAIDVWDASKTNIEVHGFINLNDPERFTFLEMPFDADKSQKYQETIIKAMEGLAENMPIINEKIIEIPSAETGETIRRIVEKTTMPSEKAEREEQEAQEKKAEL